MLSIPQRIISLVPSQTELLFALGLDKQIAGITKFCIHPEELCKHKVKIGGTKNFHFDQIDKVQPDLIIGNIEENYKEGIEKLQEKYRVWMSDIYTLEDALHMITEIGRLTDTSTKAFSIADRIRSKFDDLKPLTEKKVAYFIWHTPYMVAGSQTFINDMLRRCGYKNVFAALPRYPQITPHMLTEANPDFIFLSSEPYPFTEKHKAEFQSMCPQATIQIVDGEMFSWYGSRLLLSVHYFRNLMEELD